MIGFNYSHSTKRDLRLDLLRGYCLFRMAVVHTSKLTYFHMLIGATDFVINSVEGFFFISGYTLGMISISKDIKQIFSWILKRIPTLYLSSIGISLLFVSLHLKTSLHVAGIENIAINDFAQFKQLLQEILLLQFSVEGSDILNLYFVYLVFSIFVFWGLAKNKDILVILITAGMYIFTQIDPELSSIPIHTFRHALANFPIFFVGIYLGYRKERVANFWDNLKSKKIIDAIVIILGLIVIIQFYNNFNLMPWIGDLIIGTKIRATRMPILSLALVFLYIRIFWILTTHLWELLSRIFGWLFSPLGRSSLFTFILHLIILIFFWNYPIGLGHDINTTTLIVSAFLGILLFSSLIRQKIITIAKQDHPTLNFIVKNFPILSTSFFLIIFLLIALPSLF